MRKLALITILLPSLSFAGGPKSSFPDPRGMDAEMQNIYHDIANPVINYATISSATATSFVVSTISVSSLWVASETVKTNLTVPNGSRSTDAVAYGQILGQAPIQTVANAPAFSSSANSFVSTGLSATITPSSSTSRVRIAVTGVIGTSILGSIAEIGIFRGSTDISQSGSGYCQLTNPANQSARVPCAINVIDSPATTSATTYTVKLRADGANAAIFNPATDAGIIVEEVGAFGSGGGGTITGKTILQMITATNTSQTSTTSTSFAATSLTASITPQSTSSKILIMASGDLGQTAVNSAQLAEASIFRGASNLGNSDGLVAMRYNTPAGTQNNGVPCTMTIIDSPASTSAQAYTVEVRTTNAAIGAIWNINASQDTLILMEIL